MKKITLYIMAVCLTLSLLPLQSQARDKNEVVARPLEIAEMKVLESRLNEINEMDKSSMKHAEKKALRHEVQTIQKSMNRGGGAYISVGGIIIIILLLIILL